VSSNGISYLVGLNLTTGVETKVQTSHSYSLANSSSAIAFDRKFRLGAIGLDAPKIALHAGALGG
jgi:hypothetical protein